MAKTPSPNPITQAVRSASSAMASKGGKITGMHYAYNDAGTIVLEIDDGKGGVSTSVRVPAASAGDFKLGQRVSVETKVEGA